MDEIQTAFEDWYARGDKLKDPLLEKNITGQYRLIQANCAFEAFKAGYKAAQDNAEQETLIL